MLASSAGDTCTLEKKRHVLSQEAITFFLWLQLVSTIFALLCFETSHFITVLSSSHAHLEPWLSLKHLN